MRPKRITLIWLAALAVVTLALVAMALVKPSLDAVGANTASVARQMPTATPTPKQLKVAFIGDSYTAGAGVLPQDAWPSVLAGSRGWTIVNLARGGTGYVAAWASGGQKACGQDVCPNYVGMVPAAVAAAPDVVIVAGGRNDGQKMSSELQQNVLATFSALRKGLPNAKIIALSPILAADDSASSFPDLKPVVSAAVQAVGGTYVDLGAPLGGHPELIGPDGVHPNTAGQKALADATDKLLPKLP